MMISISCRTPVSKLCASSCQAGGADFATLAPAAAIASRTSRDDTPPAGGACKAFSVPGAAVLLTPSRSAGPPSSGQAAGTLVASGLASGPATVVSGISSGQPGPSGFIWDVLVSLHIARSGTCWGSVSREAGEKGAVSLAFGDIEASAAWAVLSSTTAADRGVASAAAAGAGAGPAASPRRSCGMRLCSSSLLSALRQAADCSSTVNTAAICFR
mmetsp:Transcript_19917/g.56088  ORF Transcript_19917/g.56088 Transcript_19917/m.56088 type:complete len:215 (+) Transcript_19917:748-1392(+)